LIISFLYIFGIFSHLHFFVVVILVQFYVISVRNCIVWKKKNIIKFGYQFSLCNRYRVHLLMKINWWNFDPYWWCNLENVDFFDCTWSSTWQWSASPGNIGVRLRKVIEYGNTRIPSEIVFLRAFKTWGLAIEVDMPQDHE
jgi:hypothetical protein